MTENAKGKGAKAPANVKVAGGPAVPVKVVPGKPGDEKKKVAKADSIFTLIKGKADNEKMPKQCQQILEVLAKAPGKALNREALLKAMTPIIETRQPIERILGFYQSRLVSGGYIKIASVEKPKAAKAAAAQEE